MSSTVTMPSVVDSMTEGVIGRWLKRDGNRVERSEELVEIETDKATVAYESPGAGYLEIVAAEGTTVSVGEVIARLAAEPRPAAPEAAPDAPAPVAGEPAAPSQAGEANGHAPEPQTAAEIRATPLARQLAEQHGVSLATVGGSGPYGRVTRSDVASSVGFPSPPPPAAPPPPSAPVVEELSRVQQTIARRMAESHATVPAFQVETEVAMDAVLALREELEQIGDGDPVPSLNDFVVRASALALRSHPRANASYRDGRFVLMPRVNVGVAVAAVDALLVPVVADADARSLFEIASETSRLVDRVRTGALAPADLADATFTVSNLGMFGMTAITPIIDLPQAAILGVGAVRATLALDKGAVVTRRLMTLRLTCDHRILYGADAARFLSAIRELLEQPLRLLR